LNLPGVWAEPTLRLTRLKGVFSAHGLEASVAGGPRRWTIESSGLEFATEDFSGAARLKWASLPGSPGQLQLNASIDRVAANRVIRYLPNLVGPITRGWVQQSIRSGTVEKIEMLVQGDLARFPFREPASGQFRVSGRMRDVALDYGPGWPGLEGLEGLLVFERVGFEVPAASGRIQGIALRTLKARMADFREGVLSVEGQGDGPAQALLEFIDRSPLASSISTFTRDLRVKGAAEMALSLQVPVFDPAATRVKGHVELAGNDLVLDSTLPPFEGVQGRIEFTESGLTLKDVKAQFLGGPLSVNATPGAAGQLRIDAQGRLQVSAIQALLDNALTQSLSGSVPYRAEINVDRRASNLRLRSDLFGLVSNLPAPLSKSEAQRLALEVRSQPLAAVRPNERPPGDRVDVKLGPDMHLALERRRDPATDRLRVQRAGFGLGSAPVLRESGLSVAMSTESFDFDAWWALLARTDLDAIRRNASEQALPGVTLVPDWVSVVADSIRIGGQTLNAVVIGASRQQGHWRANIAAQEISGHFEWLDARPGEPIGTLRAQFDRLSLSRAREGEVESALARAPERLPALEISVESLALGRVELGRLSVSAANTGSAQQPVWTLRRLEIENPHAQLSATGRWAYVTADPGAARAREVAAAAASGVGAIDPRSTELDLVLQVRDAGGLLARFGIEHAVRAAPGEVSGSLHWHGSPLAIDLPSLQGALQLSLGQGGFLRIDPGAARLVAVLNLQALGRLLTGDLFDVFREGFAFDSIKGQVAIQDGVIKTSDLTMRGPQATVTLQGPADLKQETQALQVRVVPEFNANLASVAVGAMVNPAVGLGSLAAQYVLRKPLQQALAVEFDIDGSWTEPRIRERRASSDNPSRTP
ncbi:MAG: YhdP family protein, partial [Burkholderiales bacterium]